VEEEQKRLNSKENELDNEFSDDFYFDEEDISYPPFCGEDEAEAIIPTEASENIIEPLNTSEEELPKKTLNDYLDVVAGFILRIPGFVEKTGEVTVSVISSFIKKYGVLLIIPFIMLAKAIKKGFLSLKSTVAGAPARFYGDLKNMSYELKIIRKQSMALENKKHSSYLNALRKYFVISLSRHRIVWRTVFNTAFPIVMVIIVALTVNRNSKMIFALDVFYNGTHIGYIESEDTFEKAKTDAMKLVPENLGVKADSVSSFDSEPTYKLSRVSPNQLSNQSMITENLITACDLALERACGIYIDGEFLCAVKNESDAVSVFNSLLEPSKKKANDGTIVAFVEEIDYVQGLYPADSGLIWDSLKLYQTLSQPKTKAKYHKVKKKETAKSIAKKYSLKVSQLKAFNPNVNFKKLKKGTKLLVAAETDYVRIKTMKTRKRTETIGYETVRKDNSSMLKGTTKVSQNGSVGKKVITELVTYINGRETYSTVVSTKQTKAPVNKIIQVGTKTVSVYGGASYTMGSSYSSGFIWPTRGAYTLSSRYGYRSASISGWSFHGGLDIIKAGGHSTGIPVVASASGTVVTAYSGYSGYGHTVVIDHGNGIRTRYAHMQAGSLMVRAGQRVYQGQQIGRIGSTGNVTGPHLHFEVLRNGTKVNPLGYIG